MSKSTKGLRKAGLASVAVTLTLGASLAGAGSASAVADFKFDRIGGADRYETAALVADEYGTYTEAILANGEPGSYADALTANYLSGVKKAPILLTRKDQTPSYTLAELKESGVKNITIVGGEGVVSAAQKKSLEDAGYTVTRVSGTDRFQTNAEVIEAGGAAKDLGIIATGFNFADALGAGPLAYNGHALGLSEADDIDNDVVAALKAAGVKKVIVLGGPTIVSDKVVAELKAAGIELEERIYGADRSATSTKLADFAIAKAGFTNTGANVASGYTEGYGADALAGGPLTGLQKRPMLITRDVNNVGDLDEWFKAHADTLKDGIIFGGNGAVSVAAQDTLEKAAQSQPEGSATTRPELLSAAIVGTNTEADPGTNGTTVRYVFDENLIASGANGPVFSLFHVYNNAGTQFTASEIVSASGNEVVVRYAGIALTADAQKLTVATVDIDAVMDAQGQRNPIGDASIGTASGSTTTQPAGITNAPDLVSVGNVRAATAGNTAVDFTFDEPAYVTGTSGSKFRLVLTDGTEVEGTTQDVGTPAAGAGSNPSGGTAAGGNGTTTMTVIFANPDGSDDDNNAGGQFDPTIATANIARGTVDEGTVADQQQTDDNTGTDGFQNTVVEGVANELQAAAVSNSGNSARPDLVSVTLRPGATADAADQALFTFDQAVVAESSAVQRPAFGSFALYRVDGTKSTGTAAAVNPSNPTQVLVTFASTATDNAVGGNVVDNAVYAAKADGTPENAVTGVGNQQDEEGVANTATDPGQTPGKTAGPDLTAVKIARGASDSFGNPGAYQVTYTFDEDVAETSIADAKFFIYLANGTRLQAATCDERTLSGTESEEDFDNTVVCTAFENTSGLTAAQQDARVGSAVLGTVDDGAVDDEDAGAVLNPEGAEFTTGGTGTRTN